MIRATEAPHARAGDRRAAADAGLFGRISGYLGALSTYLRARFQLAGLEAKEAIVHYAIIGALAAGAMVVAIFGYFFLWMAVIFGIAWFIPSEGAWIWVTLAVALLHFAGAVGLVFWARAKLAAPMFTATLQEFKKDNEWLTTTSGSRN